MRGLADVVTLLQEAATPRMACLGSPEGKPLTTRDCYVAFLAKGITISGETRLALTLLKAFYFYL